MVLFVIHCQLIQSRKKHWCVAEWVSSP